MKNLENIEIKIADNTQEFEQIHRLNYLTFVKEIPQHKTDESEILVDKFHHENTYLIAKKEGNVLGMLAIRDNRPFSLDTKVDDLDSLLPGHERVCEVRLLAVEKEYRNSNLFVALLKTAFRIMHERCYDLVVISGTTRQEKLYRHLGFRAFGNIVGEGEALYQPMYITKESVENLIDSTIALDQVKAELNYLPGPVEISTKVLSINSKRPVSHRDSEFVKDFSVLRTELCRRVNAKNVQVFNGSGTLANDIIAAQLGLIKGTGLVLVNGEFGRRLSDQATRAGLSFCEIFSAEGDTFDRFSLEKYLTDHAEIEWLWMTHCETSTGVLNRISEVKELCHNHNVKLCIDAISSIGACDVDLSDVYLASGVSGKAIGSLPGLAMVFYDDGKLPKNQLLPRYFDLAYYEARKGIPFTISTNAVYSLSQALEDNDWGTKSKLTKAWSSDIVAAFKKYGLEILAESECASAHVITLTLRNDISSRKVGDTLKRKGVVLSYQSDYLVQRNRIQICFMGNCKRPRDSLVNMIAQIIQKTARDVMADQVIVNS